MVARNLQTYDLKWLHEVGFARNQHVLLILGFQSEINPAIRMCFTTEANPVGRQLGFYSRKWRHSSTCGDICLIVNAVMDLPQRSHGLTTVQSWTCHSAATDLPQYSHRPVTVQPKTCQSETTELQYERDEVEVS